MHNSKNISLSVSFSLFQSTHGFDLLVIIKELRLNYYHQVKLINFIRRQVALAHLCILFQKDIPRFTFFCSLASLPQATLAEALAQQLKQID